VRVALVGPYPRNLSRVGGGVETSLTYLASGLSRLENVEPTVVTFAPGLDEPARTSVDGVAVVYLAETRRLGNLTLRAAERRRLRGALAELRPDVVHAQDALRYGYLSLRATQAPVAVSVQGVVREEVKYGKSRSARAHLRVVGVSMQRYCIRHARVLISSTPYPAEYFGDQVRGRMVDVRNPIGDRFFDIEPAPEPGRILYAGAIIPRKRLLDLVDALPRVVAAAPTTRLRVAGPERDPVYASRVRRRVQELGLESRVDFLGDTSPELLAGEYRCASLFCLPSGQETSPLSIGEAMAASVPVVAARAGGVAYLVEEGATGYVTEPGDIAGLADRVSKVLRDPDVGRTMGSAGRATAERSFRVEVVAARLRDVYEELRRAHARERRSAG
jgi:glycosyltransferase involved in cell wall biosynthesis